MDLGVYGRLPKVFSKEDLEWLRGYLKQTGQTPPNNPARSHMTNFHPGWDAVNDLLTKRLHPVAGDDITFALALCNNKHQNDDVIHTDICFRYSSLPPGVTLPKDEEDRLYYTFLIVEDYEHEYGNHKPSTYLFDKSQPSNAEIQVSYDKDSVIDPSWPTYEVSEQTKEDLADYPVELLSRFKILAVLDQDPLTVNYWHSTQYHTQDSYSRRGVKWKKYFTVVGYKKM